MNCKQAWKCLSAFSIVFFLCTSLFAQPRTVTGTVTSQENGQPLAGVTVTEKGTNKAVVTNGSGSYTITVSSNKSSLVFSFVGFADQELKVGTGNALSVIMSNTTPKLDEVVVIGYGTVKKRDLTGSVVSIKGDEVAKVPATTPIEALQGKIPGADITRANGYAGQGASIRIRGTRSVGNPSSSNSVLYIVDGVQGVAISDVNANDIQSIEVLKDASSTAVYGSRGANGVIIVTTKRGTAGKPRISFNSYAGVSHVAGYGQFMDGPMYVAFRREAYRAAGRWNSPADDAVAFNTNELAAIQKGQYTSWPDLLLHNGAQQDYQLSVAGGSERTKIYFSGDYYHEKGLMRLDNYKRYTTRMNVDQTLNKWLRAGIQAQLAFINNDIRRDPLAQASKIEPLGTAYDSAGNFIPFPLGNTTVINPLADEQPGAYARNTKTNRQTVSAYLELTPFAGLNIRSTFGALFTTSEAGSYYAKNTIDGKGANSLSSVTSNQSRNTTWETVANYSKEFGKHAITLTGVASNLVFTNTSSFAGGNNQLFGSNSFYNVGANVSGLFLGSGYSKNNLISFTERINYSYAGKYLLTLTGRSDGSSKLAPNHKWAFFPSVAAAWRISDEAFMQKQKLFSDLKVRFSYGTSGNDVIAAYATQDLLSSIAFSYNDASSVPAYTIASTIGNPDLKWELTTTKNLGVDFGIVKNRITASVDYYYAITHDLISSYPLPLSTGVVTVNRNFGKTKNQGIEVSLNSRNIATKSFTWNTTVTFTKNTEKIVELPNGSVIADDYRNSLIVGQSPTIYYDYKKIGIWQTSEATEAAKFGAIPGDIKVADLAGGADGKPDGKITGADRTIIGSRVPKWSGGLSNDFRFKGFDANIFVFARIGQWISSDYYAKFNRNAGDNAAIVDYWTPENPTNAYPRPYLGRTFLYQTTLTEREASFVKIRSITLGYTLPKSVTGRFKIDNLRIYVTGRNLHTFTDLKDFDPEGEGVIDRPLNRLYTAGVNLTF